MVLREPNDPLNQSRGIMGPLENATGVQNNRGRLRQRFDLIRKLGQGTYGKVQLGIDKETGQEVAIKTIKKSKIETEADLIRIRREIQIMSSVRHPNIIHIYEVFENREKMVLVMEYAAGGELYDYLNERKVLQDDEARRIFRQIASAVYYCHKHKICHRDLKLENILLDEKFNAKIADFGLSNVFDEINLLKTFCGSPLYASPEIVRGTPYKGPEVDCWSLGVLLYTLVYGAMPFDGSNFKRLVKQISHGDYFEPKKPAEASPLIRIMLTVDPNERANIRNVCSHPWVNRGFDKECIIIADELATQTPVRLDLLLALANCSAINHSQIVVEQQPPPIPPQPNAAAAGNDRDVAPPIPPPPSAEAVGNHVRDKESPAVPPKKPKRGKVQSKSKSSPMLELIKDVEEDLELPPPEGKPRDNEEDACDTLSEISEIQTIAEDLDSAMAKAGTASDVKANKVLKKDAKATAKPASSKPSAAVTAQLPRVEAVPSPTSNVAQDTGVAPTTETKVKKTEAESETSKTAKKAVPPTEVPTPATAAPVLPAEEKTPVKKKVVKPKVVDADKSKLETAGTPPVPPSTTVTTTEKGKEKEAVPSSRETTPAPSIKEKSSTPDKDGSGESAGEEGKTTKQKLKDRADSVSPTRIERRNSKVISQKTAELIQNLETKVSPNANQSGTGGNSEPPPKPPGIKKIVIPSFKVSDAKSKFESKPPRPLTTSVSRSKAAFEAKLQSQSSVEEKPSKSTPPKQDSPPVESSKVASKPPEQPSTTNQTGETLQKSVSGKEAGTAKSESIETPVKNAEVEKEAQPQTDATTQQPSKPATPRGPGKIQIPTALAANTQQEKVSAPTSEVKPVMMDSGKGAPRPAMMVVKDQQGETGKSGGTPPPHLGPAAAAKQKLLSKMPPTPPAPAQQQPSIPSPPNGNTTGNKEQAAKKISSVITKIVNSGSADKGLNTEEGPKKFSTLPRAVKPESEKIVKTEVVFPVSAPQQQPQTPATPKPAPLSKQQPSQERIIPIKLVDDVMASSSSPPQTPSTPTATAAPSASPSVTSVTSRSSVITPAASRSDRMNSMGSLYSRQNSSETESCSVATAPQKMEPIRKCPREFLIPIKLEGSGQTVTPREELTSGGSTADASQAGEDDFRIDSRLRSGRFARPKRYSSLLSDSSFEEDGNANATSGVGAVGRRSSAATTTGVPGAAPTTPTHARSRSQGDEPVTPGGTFKRYRNRRHATAAPDMPLDRSDSFSSAEEDEEDAFQVLTAESLFSNLLDRVRNLTRRINRDDPLMAPNWSTDPTTFGLWGASPLREFMSTSSRAPSETRSFASTGPGSYRREPSVTMNNSAAGPGGAWRRSLSRDLSGDSDSGHSASINTANGQSRSQLSRLSSDLYETGSARSLPLSSRRSPSSYLNHHHHHISNRSIENDHLGPLHSSSSRPSYSRTLSHTSGAIGDYSGTGVQLSATPGAISRTLPLRRSLKTFDRGPQSILPEYDTSPGSSSGIGMSSSTLNHRHSLLDSKYDNPSSYLTRLRSASRDRHSTSGVSGSGGIADREGSTSRIRPSLYMPPSSSGEANGWEGGHDATSSSSLAASSISSSSNINNASSSSYQTTPHSTGVSLDSESSILSPASPFSYSGIEPHLQRNGNGSSDSSRLLSVQEKMNNYSNYYQSLTQSPFRRLPLASPSQIHANSSPPTSTISSSGSVSAPVSTSFGVGLSELRNGIGTPLSLLPVSNLSRPGAFQPSRGNVLTEQVTNNSSLLPLKVEPPPEVASSSTTSGSTTPNVQSPVSHTLSSVTSPSISPQQIASPVSVVSPTKAEASSSYSPKSLEEMKASKPPVSASPSSNIPRWPSVSVRQHRPLSISSFPDGQRASSVSRVMSPPPVQQDKPPNFSSSNGPSKENYNSAASIASSVQKKRESRATSVERITRLLERKSMPREMPSTNSNTAVATSSATPIESDSKKKSLDRNVADETAKVNGEVNGLVPLQKSSSSSIKKPKFLQSLEKKWEKLTQGGQTTTNKTESQENLSKSEEAKTLNVSSSGREGSVPDSPEPHQAGGTSEESSTHEDTKINESVLLRRALSPEKKVKSTASRLGSTSSSSGGTVNFMLGKFKKFEETPAPQAGSKIPTGKPPLLAGNPLTSRLGKRIQIPYTGANSDSVLSFSSSAAKEIGRSSGGGDEDGSGMVKTAAVVAQEKRRFQPRIQVKKDIPTTQEVPQTAPIGSFSQTPSPTTPPKIQIQEEDNIVKVANSEIASTTAKASPKMDMSSLSPHSIGSEGDRSESDDSQSQNQPVGQHMSTKSDSGSVTGDDAESVSDRILRKSFYNRFNASNNGIDRNRRAHSVTPGSSRRIIGTSTTSPSSSSNNNNNNLKVSTSGGNGNSGPKSPHHNHHHHHHHIPQPTTPTLRRSVSPAASTIASYESKESSGGSEQSNGQNGHPRSPSPYWSGLNKYNPNPLFKELMIGEEFRTGSGSNFDVGKKTEYSRRITSKLSKLLREIESDLNSCQLTKTGSEVSEDGEGSGLLLGNREGRDGIVSNGMDQRTFSPTPNNVHFNHAKSRSGEK